MACYAAIGDTGSGKIDLSNTGLARKRWVSTREICMPSRLRFNGTCDKKRDAEQRYT